MPRKVRSTLQIMISFIFILMSTRTEPYRTYRNSILAKKKKKKKNKQKPNQNKTKDLENRFRFDCCTGSSGPLLVPRSAILSTSATGPWLGPGLCTDSRLPSGNSGRDTDFFRGKGGVCTQLDRSLPVQYLQSFFNILINIFKFQYFTLYQFQIAPLSQPAVIVNKSLIPCGDLVRKQKQINNTYEFWVVKTFF